MSKIIVIVSLKDGILDPQGKAILHAMKGLDFNDCESVSGGKIFELSFPELDNVQSLERGKQAAEKILVNPNIESYTVQLKEES